MANIVYRKGTTPTTNVSTSFKGNALTNDELDGNFFGIDSEVQTKAPINNAVFTGTTTIPTAIISGGTANSLTIGNVTPAPATFTTVTTTGNVTVGDASEDILLIQAGSQTSPALVKSGDLDTGIWFPADNIFAVSAGGSERIRFTSTLATVTGDQTITGDLAVNGGDITTTVTTGSFNFLNSGLTGPLNIGGASTAIAVGANTGTLTLRNPTVVGGTSTTVNLWNTVATTVNFGGVASITMGALGTGTTTIRNATTAVSNALTVGTTAAITGNTTVGGTLGVTGATTLSSTLGVTGATTLSSTLGVTGVTTLSNNATVGGTLGVTGATTLSSTLTTTGNATFNSNVTIGDATADTLTINARLATGLTWATDNTNDIGASGANRARDLFLGRNAAIGGTLGVTGATTLSSTLGVTGATTLSSTLGVTGATTLNSTLGVSGNTTVGGTLGVTGATTISNTLSVSGNTNITGASTFTVGTGATTLGGTLGVTGATTLSSTLAVTGNTTVGGTLGVTGATTLSSTLGVTGLATFNNGVTVAGSTTAATEYFRITDGAGSPVTTFLVDSANGNTTISGTLGVTGATTLSSTLGVTGATTLNNTLSVSNNATLGGTLTVTGDATLNANLTLAGSTTAGTQLFTITNGDTVPLTRFQVDSANGNTTISGTLGVTGATTMSSTLGVSGNTTVGGTLGVTGATTIAGNTSITGASTFTVGTGATTLGGTLGVTSNTTVGGTLGVTGATTLSSTLVVSGASTFNGNVTFGDATSDTVSLTSRLATGVLWATDNAQDIGASGANRARDLFLGRNASVGGTLSVTGATTLSSTLGVTGATTLSSTLGVSGNTTVGGTLGVTGATTLSSTLGVTGLATFNNGITIAGSTTAATELFTITNGDTVPLTRFQVDTANGNTTIAGTLGVTGATTLSSTLGVTGATTLSSTLAVTSNTTVGGTLGVTGATTLSSTLVVSGASTFNGNVTFGDATSDTVSLTSRLATGILWATDNTQDIGASGANRARDLFLGRNASVGGTLGVTGATTLSSTLGVTGATTLSSTLAVTSNATVGGTLGVTGATTLSSTLGVTGLATFNNGVTVAGSTTAATEYFRITDGAGSPVTRFLVDSANGNTTISGTLGVTGATTLSSTLAVTSNTTVGGTLGVTGATTLSSTLSVSGAATFNGNVTFGDATSDTVSLTSRLATGILWATDNAQDIGASGANRARDLFLGRNADIQGTLYINGTTTLNGAVTGNSTISCTRLTSTQATGTAPLTVNSTTKVANLNVDRVDDISFAAPTQTGGIPYVSATAAGNHTVSFVGAGVSGTVLTSSGGSAPTWTAISGLSAGSSFSTRHVLGGSTGDMLYQSVLTKLVSTTVGSKTVTMTSTTDLLAGMIIDSNPNIPFGAYIESVDSATQITITEFASATASSISTTFLETKKLSIGGTNQVLTSNGTIPTWSSTLTVDQITHSGLVPTAGTNIDQVYTVTDSLTLNSTGWFNTSVNAAELATGSYMVQVTTGNELYTGMMSWFSGDINSAVVDEIVLHRASAGTESSNLFLRVERTDNDTSPDMTLQVSSSVARTVANYTFKFRRMM